MNRPCTLLALLLVVGCWNRVLAGPPGDQAKWIPVMIEDFQQLDRNRWQTSYGWGARTLAENQELEWYVDGCVTVVDGIAYLTADRARPGELPSQLRYRSGMISGHPGINQLYGYFEARIKIPKGKGLWPAFWLLPLPLDWPPEIDIMEASGFTPTDFQMVNHWSVDYPHAGGGLGGSVIKRSSGPDLSADFHTYGLLWEKDKLVWYLDGEEKARVTDHIPQAGYGITGMYPVVNLAVGGRLPGSPDDSTIFPATMAIDWVAIYRQVDSGR